MNDWLNNIKKYSKSTIIYVIGNKVDLHGFRHITEDQHNRFIIENSLSGGMFMSAKTGENVVKTFYKVAGEAIGIKLNEYELSFHNKILKAHITSSNNDNDCRTAFADEIEAEDAAAEARKNKKHQMGCSCS